MHIRKVFYSGYTVAFIHSYTLAKTSETVFVVYSTIAILTIDFWEVTCLQRISTDLREPFILASVSFMQVARLWIFKEHDAYE